jgi:hypothetical protein
LTDEHIAQSIGQYAVLLQQQLQKANGWPASFVFPEPANDAERKAFSQFIALIEQTSGKKVKFTTTPQTQPEPIACPQPGHA